MMLNTQCSTSKTRDPFQALLGRLFGDPIGEPNGGNPTGRRHSPLTNISETDKTYVLSFELPGVTEADIQVQLQDKTLTVTAERKDVRDVADNKPAEIAAADGAKASENPTEETVRWH